MVKNKILGFISFIYLTLFRKLHSNSILFIQFRIQRQMEPSEGWSRSGQRPLAHRTLPATFRGDPCKACSTRGRSENEVVSHQQNFLPAGKANRALLCVEEPDVPVRFRSRFYRPLDLPSWHRCRVGDFLWKLKGCRSLAGSVR